MLIHIRSHTFPLTEFLKEYVESRVRLALDRHRSKITSISVTLTDINGPRGGEAMRCSISLKMNRLPAIVIQETAADMYDAINICAHRAKRSASRQVAKLHQHRKVSHHQYLEAQEG